MAEAVTPDTVMAWFKEYQKSCIVKDGVVPEWFHGIISRKQSEEMLMAKPLGCFLIRVSESRFGYTLSYKAEDHCRHFMIDMLQDNQYVIVGENMPYRSLQDLVDFHRQTPIAPYTELLTIACGQVSEYDRFILPTSPTGVDVWSNRPSAQANVPEDLPPALPARPSMSLPTTPTQNPSTIMIPATSTSCQRLYPSLEQELSALNMRDTECPNPIPTPRTKLINTAPLTTIGNMLNQVITGEDKRKGLPTGSSDPAPEQKAKPKSQIESKPNRTGLALGKKIFWKKRSHSEQHMYTSINEDEMGKEINGFKRDPQTKPAEYLKPPPFAPGY